MSADNDRMRRILGIHLAEAGGKAGVTGPIERGKQPDHCNYDTGSPDVLHFSSFNQFQLWCEARERKS